jgi:hypothetical protein
MGVVLCGGITSLFPCIIGHIGKSQDAKVSETSLFFAIVYIASVVLTALDFVLKESIFWEHLNIEIFVVNMY